MDITRFEDITPTVMHETTIVHSYVPKFTLREQTQGSYLELVDLFEVKPGAVIEPHYHNTHEFYYILSGECVVQIEDEARRLKPGDLVRIPPNARHSAWPIGDESMKGFCFAVSYQEPYEPGYIPCDLPRVPVSDH